jgi:hypothetical protein
LASAGVDARLRLLRTFPTNTLDQRYSQLHGVLLPTPPWGSSTQAAAQGNSRWPPPALNLLRPRPQWQARTTQLGQGRSRSAVDTASPIPGAMGARRHSAIVTGARQGIGYTVAPRR